MSTPGATDQPFVDQLSNFLSEYHALIKEGIALAPLRVTMTEMTRRHPAVVAHSFLRGGSEGTIDSGSIGSASTEELLAGLIRKWNIDPSSITPKRLAKEPGSKRPPNRNTLVTRVKEFLESTIDLGNQAAEIIAQTPHPSIVKKDPPSSNGKEKDEKARKDSKKNVVPALDIPTPDDDDLDLPDEDISDEDIRTEHARGKFVVIYSDGNFEWTINHDLDRLIEEMRLAISLSILKNLGVTLLLNEIVRRGIEINRARNPQDIEMYILGDFLCKNDLVALHRNGATLSDQIEQRFGVIAEDITMKDVEVIGTFFRELSKIPVHFSDSDEMCFDEGDCERAFIDPKFMALLAGVHVRQIVGEFEKLSDHVIPKQVFRELSNTVGRAALAEIAECSRDQKQNFAKSFVADIGPLFPGHHGMSANSLLLPPVAALSS